MNERRTPGEEESSGTYGDEEPQVERIDKEAEQRELEDAGWEKVERAGKVLWRNPVSDHLYPQGAAIALLRAGKVPWASEAPEGDE